MSNPNDSTQTEISSKNGMVLKATIIWKYDWEYVLTYEKTTNRSLKDFIGKKDLLKYLKFKIVNSNTMQNQILRK
jgi:hypothetical protein